MTARDPGPVSHPVSQLTLLGAAATLENENAAAADHTVVPPPNARSKGLPETKKGTTFVAGSPTRSNRAVPFRDIVLQGGLFVRRTLSAARGRAADSTTMDPFRAFRPGNSI